ncbi:ORC-CDC6 family AAA ATPase, partial [Vibrio parahaemolyticus]
ETSKINDYSIVELWYVKKGESNEFCSNLVKSKFDLTNPSEKLGVTKFGSRFNPDLRNWVKEFDELYEKDVSFKAFILSKKIDYRKEFESGNAVS